jgi:quercetin dioxygenase-like cupin family protein
MAIMRRYPIFVLIGVVLAGALTSRIAAQEASPRTGAPIAALELAPGVTAEIFAAPSAVSPGQTVYLARFVSQPGAKIVPHGHPGTTVLGVESGSFGWTLSTGTAHVVRAAASGSPEPVEDLSESGAEVILEPGDAIYDERDVIHTARGAGGEPAVVLGTLVLETGRPLIMPADMEMPATPAA